ncbi:MAG: toll/interleukin-1 receptor domain-containing protein [Mesorhizobium sp.]|uniref:toll/interleukin-1 receptor domain-containing protein n=1 Tax=Mesorhizobium sp. TaxID=1871066 RepID=UPI0012239E29|nr:toll/interleukin-1 receptor domain-containing protein [Mesorhizobium sp.]TIR04268.1 MAG: toll/interleukin-1 receptor domain-containing protein [Mesorhizobium sp.]
MLYDVFISHASEDKEDFVRPLAAMLIEQHLDVWYDELVLRPGDSLRESIDRGLAQSRFGVVVLSPAFFSKNWTNWELNGLVARQTAGEQVVVPVWHGVTKPDVLAFSPPLADVFAPTSEQGIEEVVQSLLRILKPIESQLIVARDYLVKRGVTPPVVTDQWWFDIIEQEGPRLRAPGQNVPTWIFPPPFLTPQTPRERGINIAWAALQVRWSQHTEADRITQLTAPEYVHKLLDQEPGLSEHAGSYPGFLALHAPQLTLPGLEHGFSSAFDALLDVNDANAYRVRPEGPSDQTPEAIASVLYPGPRIRATVGNFESMARGRSKAKQVIPHAERSTTNGRAPLCGELIAWRHPSFGNYNSAELFVSFVGARNILASRMCHSYFQCIVWLLSSASNWMPKKLRRRLIQGSKMYWYGWASEFVAFRTPFGDALRQADQRQLETRKVLYDLKRQVAAALHELHQSPREAKLIAEEFFENGHVDAAVKQGAGALTMVAVSSSLRR